MPGGGSISGDTSRKAMRLARTTFNKGNLMHPRVVDEHLQHLLRNDPDFGSKWPTFSSELKFWYVFALREIEARRLLTRRAGLARTHSLCLKRLERYCRSVPEQDFVLLPDAEEWIRFSCDRQKGMDALRRWEVRLSRFVDRNGFPGLRVDYNLKGEDAIQAKIRQYREGKARLDLWDYPRTRVCTSGIVELLAFAESFRAEFSSDIVRTRNYLLRPRKWPANSSYWALHFEVRSGGSEFVEVQVMTARRDAICLIDHSLVLKKSIPFRNREDRAWLRQMSYVANILDTEQLLAGFQGGDTSLAGDRISRRAA